MRLTEIEAGSALWGKLEKHWNIELGKLRLQNEGNLTELETAHLRGRIAAVKASLAIGAMKKQIEIE